MESAEHPGGSGSASRGVLTVLAVATGLGLAANAVWTAVNLRTSQSLEWRAAQLAARQGTLIEPPGRAFARPRRPIVVVPFGGRAGRPPAPPEPPARGADRSPLVACVTVRYPSGIRIYAVRDPLWRFPPPGNDGSHGESGLVVRRRTGPPIRIAEGRLLGSVTTYLPASRCPADVVF
ncbi:MAG: hypothetical protein IRZ00_20140 [Gemmatimonadetes bacterium]|nr:hypothetical protein [Gemmatimonadota bacterium]